MLMCSVFTLSFYSSLMCIACIAGLFIAVVMVIHAVYFSIIETGQVFAYDAFVRTHNS